MYVNSIAERLGSHILPNNNDRKNTGNAADRENEMDRRVCDYNSIRADIINDGEKEWAYKRFYVSK